MPLKKVEDLVTLRRENFDYREWLALCFAREGVFSRGKVSGWEFLSEYEGAYTRRERKYILKLIRLMEFFNCAGNIFIRIPGKYSIKTGDSCTLPGAGKPAGRI